MQLIVLASYPQKLLEYIFIVGINDEVGINDVDEVGVWKIEFKLFDIETLFSSKYTINLDEKFVN